MKYLWVIDCTGVAEYDTFDEALHELLDKNTHLINDIPIERTKISIMSEEEFLSL